MRCEHAHDDFKPLLDGELPLLRRAQVRWHMARCSECAAQFATLRRLNALVRSNDIFSNALPNSTILNAAQETQRMARRIAVGIVATGTLTLLLLTVPRSHRTLSLAAEVKQALQNANVWHLKGWQEYAGKRVPWEMWGRRQPFFFQEQFGDDITLDDGTQRLQRLAPDSRWQRKQAIVVRTASNPETGSRGWLLATKADRWRSGVRPNSETAETATFRFRSPGGQGGISYTESVYIVNKATFLPAEIAVVQSNGKVPRTTESLHADYPANLPDAITKPRWNAGLSVADALAIPADAHLPTANAVHKQGFTLQVTPLAMDAQGMVLVRARGWLGDFPLDNVHGLSLQIQPGREWWEKSATAAPHLADSRVPYISIQDNLGGDAGPDGTRLYQFAPLEPLPMRTRPTHLRLNLRAMVHCFAPHGSEITSQDLTITVPLPAKAASADPARYGLLPTLSLEGPEPLEAILAYNRAFSYCHDFGGPNQNRARLHLSAKWMKRAVTLSRTSQGLWWRDGLAERYLSLGQKEKARQTWQELIARKDKPLVMPAWAASRPPQEQASFVAGLEHTRRSMRQVAEARLHDLK